MKQFFRLIILITLSNVSSCNGQHNNASTELKTHKIVGGGCDGYALMNVGMTEIIQPIDPRAGWFENGQKLQNVIFSWAKYSGSSG